MARRRWYLWGVLAVTAVLAVGLYKAKTDAAATRARIQGLESELRGARRAVAALEAEVAALEAPARVEALARVHLGAEPGRAGLVRDLDELSQTADGPLGGAQ